MHYSSHLHFSLYHIVHREEFILWIEEFSLRYLIDHFNNIYEDLAGSLCQIIAS